MRHVGYKALLQFQEALILQLIAIARQSADSMYYVVLRFCVEQDFPSSGSLDIKDSVYRQGDDLAFCADRDCP